MKVEPVPLLCAASHGKVRMDTPKGIQTSAVFVIVRTFDEPMEYPLGADFFLSGACKPTLQWDPKPRHKAPTLNSGFSKALTRHRWRVFYARSATHRLIFA